MEIGNSAQPTRMQRIMRSNREDEHVLVADSLAQAGMPVPNAADAARAQEAGYVAVPVGTEVYRPGQNDPDVVVGASDGHLHTVSRNPNTGALERHSLPFSSYAEHSQSLWSDPSTVQGFTGAQLVELRRGVHTPKGFNDHLWAPTDTSIDDVAALGSKANITLQQTDAPKGTVPSETQVPAGFWSSDVRQSEALTPVAVAPTKVDHVANLRWTVNGDHHIIESDLGHHNQVAYFDKPDAERPAPAARDRVIGTDSMPMRRGQPVLDRINGIEQFFSKYVDAHGVMPKDRQVIGLTDVPDNLVNAYIQPLDRGRVELGEGPRPYELNQSLLHEVPSDARSRFRHINQLLRDYSTAVFGHEGDHVNQIDNWGSPDERTDPQALSKSGQLKSLEQGEVMEAFSDTAGFARTGKPSVGVRDLRKVDRYEQTLGGLRALEARLPADALDPHMGTQLITQPLVAFGEAHGPTKLAEVLGAATRQIGTDLREGRYDWADIPHAASALHDAAAARLTTDTRSGYDDPSVVRMRAAWDKLGVPLRDPKYASWGDAETRTQGMDPATRAMKLGEEQQVRSAFDDLDRVTSMKRPNSAAIRSLTRIRATEQGARAILTAPLGNMIRQHGTDAVAAISHSAQRTLSTQLQSGRMRSVTVPDAARAIVDATAVHFNGKYSAPAAHVANGYKQLFHLEGLQRLIHG